MKSTSSTYKSIIASGNARNYLITVYMTLADSTSLTITEEDMLLDSFKLETASSGSSSFDIGCAIIGKCSFSLINFEGDFSNYDFFNATASVWVKLVGDTEYHRMGFFTVDEPTYNNSIIQLEMLDNMWKLDVPLSEVNLTFPLTCLAAVNAVCSYCGVILATQTFNGYSFTLSDAPEQDMNCREFIQYVAMLGCNFCVMNDAGTLNIKWYDTSSLPTDKTYDENTVSDNPSVAYFTRNFTAVLGTDEIEITGIKITIDDVVYTRGTSGYVLEIENPLITTDNVATALNLIWAVLSGFTLRTFSINTLSDLSCEVGDCCGIVDAKGNLYYSWITTNTFRFTGHTVQCNAVTPTRTLTKRYSKTVQQAVEIARQNIDETISDFDLAVQMMNNLAVNAMGGYMDYEDLSTGGRVWYLSNEPITKTSGVCSFESGSVVFKLSGTGFFVSTDAGTTWVNGYDATTGALVVNVLYAIGLSAEWIKTGTLDVGGSGTNATIRVKDSSDNVICTIDTNGITMSKGVLQSADYSYTSGVYSDTGMIIDLVNTFMRSTAFYLNNNGGHIGAAEFDENGMSVGGNITLYEGTGSFTFRPIDYGIASEIFTIGFVATSDSFSGTITITITGEYDDGTSITTETITLTDTDEETTVLRLYESGDDDNYSTYTITISGSDSVTITLQDEIAYLGVGGLRGLLTGIFKGYLESNRGKISNLEYDETGFKGDVYTRTSDGYGSEQAGVRIDVGNATDKPTISRSYTESGSTESEDVVWESDLEKKQNYIDLDILAPTSSAQEGDLVFMGSQGTEFKRLYRYDDSTNGWVQIALCQYSTTDLTAGTSALNEGEVYLVYE